MTPVPPPPRRRLPAADRRAAILHAAQGLFAERGYHGVSVDEIAARLKISPAVLYRHFTSKEALYEQLMDGLACERVSYTLAALAEPSDFGSVLARITRVFVRQLAQNPDSLRMELLSALEGGEAERQFFATRWKTFADYIETGLVELQQQGCAAPIEPEVASLMFRGMIRELLYGHTVLRQDADLDAVLRRADALVGLFLRAVSYRAESGPVRPAARRRISQEQGGAAD